MKNLEVLFSPADFSALARRDLTQSICVVFDILRATSTMVTALSNGAAAILPLEDIPAALNARRQNPRVLLAGERHGVRISAALSGGPDFDLGNSPREFTPAAVSGRTLAMTTTNGTRALRACQPAGRTLVASFLNLRATAQLLLNSPAANLLLVCSGTGEEPAFEDILGAGAMCDLLWEAAGRCADSSLAARSLFRQELGDLPAAFAKSCNGRRLLALPELKADVAFCAQRDAFPILAQLDADGFVRRV